MITHIVKLFEVMPGLLILPALSLLLAAGFWIRWLLLRRKSRHMPGVISEKTLQNAKELPFQLGIAALVFFAISTALALLADHIVSHM